MKAFTLLELLVVLAVILVMAAIGALFYGPDLVSSRQVADGSQSVQHWLVCAQQMAKTNQTICGVRFYAGNNWLCNTAQYVRQPDSWQPAGGAISTAVTWGTNADGTISPTGYRATAIGFLFSDTGNPQDSTTWPIQPHDFLMLYGGRPHLIKTVTPTYLDLNIDTTASYPAGTTEATGYQSYASTKSFEFVQRPQPIASEPTLTLPGNVVVDFNAGNVYGSLPEQAGIMVWDVLFQRSGQPENVSASLYLWVRDGSLPNVGWTYAGVNHIVAVRATGMIASYDVDPLVDPNSPGGPGMPNYLHPYNFAQQGR